MKTVDEIYGQMLSDFQARIGAEVSGGCDLAVRLYAVAAQIAALNAQTEWVKKQCFPQTAQGEYLDYHAQMRALSRKGAVHAAGVLRFSLRAAAEEDVEIPAGTVCMNAAGERYETVQAAAIASGEVSVDVPGRAVEPGTAGNTAAGTILVMSLPPTGVASCSNPEAFTGGEEEEEDESLRARILDSYQRLPNGANAAFYESQALLHEGVAAAKAVGRARGVGTVDVYVATAAGLPEEELLEEIQAELEEKREIAVDVQVLAPAQKQVDVTLTLETEEGAADETVAAAAEVAVRGYFSGALLGKPVLLSQLYALLHKVEGLHNYHVLSPAADIAAEDTVLPVLGALNISTL